MSSSEVDVLFVGNGLANRLMAHRLQQLHPQVSFLILEKHADILPTHTWSYFESDLDPGDRKWVRALASQQWSGYTVEFPSYRREFVNRYASIRETDLNQKLDFTKQLRLSAEVVSVSPHRVTLKGGQTLRAKWIIDGRGWDLKSMGKVGYQKFLGQSIKLKSSHGLKWPLLMDATVKQQGGFRFFYLLPWDAERILIEETYYSLQPNIVAEHYRKNILNYCRRRGWQVEAVEYEEKGCLPIPLDSRSLESVPGVGRSGLRAGLFHPTTGYSFAEAVRFATHFASLGPDFSDNLVLQLDRYAKRHWRSGSIYRLLNRWLYWGSPPEKSYRILESFYQLPEWVVRQFYAGRMGGREWGKFFWRRPPIPLREAIRYLFSDLRESDFVSKARMMQRGPSG